MLLCTVMVPNESYSESAFQRHLRGNDTETIVNGLLVNESYVFSVMAENHAGKGPPSATVVLNTTRESSDYHI